MNKKITLVAAVAVMGFSSAFAQVQRMVLVEEFTQASCGPCAAQNPAFNATLAPNLSVKVAAIKYQTNWPGVDPMNTQTQTWVGPRVSYYAVNGVPDAIVDGNVYQGAPSGVTQSGIDTRYAVGSPFQLDLTHTMSPDFDSIFITANITAAQAFTSNGALKLHVALIEKEIIFSSPPGSNGELDFYGVMRQMLPNASGTTLNGTWANADNAVFTFAVAKPSYIYDVNQLQVVAFIQSDGNKEVQQAAITNPIALPNDAQPTALAGLPSTGLACSAVTFTPAVTVKNTGANTLTSLDINVSVASVAQPVYNWTGSIAPGATSVITLPAVTYNGASGNVAVTVSTANPNATVDVNTTNDTRNGSFLYYGGTAQTSPYQQGFTATAFPPGIVGIINNDNDTYTWARSTAGGFAQGVGSARLNFYNAAAGTVDDMVLGNFDMTTASVASMTFSVAYRQYSSENDRLQVMVSTDCGATWATVFDKQGSTLATVAAATTSFTPNNASQWRSESVSLANYANATNLIIKFVGTSDYGNNLYVDDINIGTVGVEEAALAGVGLNIFPNPFDASTTVQLNLEQTENITVEVYSLDGKLVQAENKGEMNAGQHNIMLDGANLADGMYFVTIRTGNNGTITRKVTVAH
ncbi:MAG: T9SS type A sorting domain-containing protein [Bacteroidetes bacterium]|nr:T9SS type A sorting domain-containing protein [Bacteroidota bacterium]